MNDLILQKELPHQQKAVEALSKVFQNLRFEAPTLFFENPTIPLFNPLIAGNIREIQNSIPTEFHSVHTSGDYLNLDIKMETGTGKTYVYAKTIYELHRRYKLNKFIIAVPSLAIKAGTGQFVQDEYVKKHFSDVCGYGTEIEVGILGAPKNKKKGRSFFPSTLYNLTLRIQEDICYNLPITLTGVNHGTKIQSNSNKRGAG